VTVSGQDGPGLAARLFAALGSAGVRVDDVEQVRVHGRLLLCVEAVLAPNEAGPLADALAEALAGAGVEVALSPLAEAVWPQPSGEAVGEQHLVTVLAPEVDAGTLEGVTGRIASCGGNIERIVRLAAYPVHSYELTVAGADLVPLRRALAEEAVRRRVDVAVQVAGLHRRAKHLIVLDADSTLWQGEVIDLLAARCGCAAEVAAVTAAAMAGELDFEEALRQRVRLLAGL
jgi:phosphoserine phosphatase